MFFEADINQIAQLDSLELVKLMKLLLLAECRTVDIPLRATTVPLQITVADGGEDGRVSWSKGLDSTDFFPARFCVFQSKAQNLTETSIAAEVLKKPRGRGRAYLNAAVCDALSNRGAYVVFCSHRFGGQKIGRLRQAIAEAIRRGQKNPSALKAIEIYDANRIAMWVNTHPPVALWLASLNRRRSLAGFQSHEAWGREDEIKNITWVADDTARFSNAARRNVWTFDQAAEAALDCLAKDKAILRIAGPSGFGKSRFIYEMFNRQANVSGDVDRTVVIYADLVIAADEVAKLALEIADAGSSAILVVDDCPDEVHSKLVAIARRAGSRLRLVTIDVETKVQDALVIRLEAASDTMIGSIANSVARGLSESDTRFIEEIAKGFPKMAVLAARQEGRSRPTISSAEEILDRVVWGRRHRVEEAQKALELLSLFEWVGLGGRVAEEGNSIAEKLGDMTQDAFAEHIMSFTSRGVILQREESVQVSPIPLAVFLGAKRLTLVKDKLLSFFLEAPIRLKIGLLRRLRWLDTSQAAKAFARGLLAYDCMGNLATINTNWGSECLHHLVHVDPDLVMATIHRVFDGSNADELQLVSDGRRYLVWALEKLAFRNESFDGAATLLRRLAASETETTFSNNATGQFTQLYQLYLSGTEASPAMRLLVLDDGLRSLNLKEREVCVGALNKMLQTHHFSRGGGAEEIGTRERLKDWVPSTNAEIWDFFRASLKRLTEIATGSDPLAVQAKNILASHIRGLIGRLPFEEVKTLISQIKSHYGFWPDAVEKVNEWLYFDRKEASKELADEVRTYFDELMPSDPVDLAVQYTHGWQSDFHDPDVDYEREVSTHLDFEYATRKAVEIAATIANDTALTERALDRFVVSEGKTVMPLARRIAELAPSATELFNRAIEKVELAGGEANLDFFSGLIAGADTRDPQAARECVRLALNSQKLKPNAISMIGAGKLQSTDIALVVSLLQTGDVRPMQCASLSYGKGMAHLETRDIIPLLKELSQKGGEGLFAVIDIITMLVHGGRELDEDLLSVLQSVLLNPNLLDTARTNHRLGYNLERTITSLVRRDLIGPQFARALINQLLSICTPARADVFYELSRYIRDSLKVLIGGYAREVWTAIAKLLVTKDYLIRHRIETLIGSEHDDHMGPGFLHAMPADLYLEWVREDPVRRASIVMKWVPITIKREDGTLAWHLALESFVSEFGGEEGVLDALSSRLHPRAWYGSLTPHVEPLLKPLESWASHPQPKVRQWVRERINWIQTQV
jgi:hypothetical protein